MKKDEIPKKPTFKRSQNKPEQSSVTPDMLCHGPQIIRNYKDSADGQKLMIGTSKKIDSFNVLEKQQESSIKKQEDEISKWSGFRS